MFISDVANLLAADLAGAQVDPNEAQKALAYLRKQRDGKAFFRYLQAIKKHGKAVIRSGQTLRYYDELLAACERHLRPLQNEPDQMLTTLAWAIRLLRYYRAVPEAAQELAAQRQLAQAPQQHGLSAPTNQQQPDAQSAPLRPAVPLLPAVGAVFAGTVTARDEDAVLVVIPGFDEVQAIGVMKAEAIQGGRTDRFRVGNAARVEVTGVRQLKSGRTIVELKPGARREKG